MDSVKQKRLLSLFFFLYLLILIKMIVFKYPLAQMKEIVDAWQKEVVLEGWNTANFIPFKTIKMYIQYYQLPGIRSFSNLFGNILIFIPIGFMLPVVHKASKNVLIMFLNALFLVLGIEIFQLFSNFGAFDVDDIILNCFGVLMGRCLYQILWKKEAQNSL